MFSGLNKLHSSLITKGICCFFCVLACAYSNGWSYYFLPFAQFQPVLSLRKWGYGQVFFPFLAEPALFLLLIFIRSWMIHLALTSSWMCPQIQKGVVPHLWVNLVPKQQGDTQCDSSAAGSSFIKSSSVLQFSLTFLSTVCIKRSINFAISYHLSLSEFLWRPW